jgi:hypothetical protein
LEAVEAIESEDHAQLLTAEDEANARKCLSPDAFSADGVTLSVVLKALKAVGRGAHSPNLRADSSLFAGCIHRSAAGLARANSIRWPIVVPKRCLGGKSSRMAIPFAAYQQEP